MVFRFRKSVKIMPGVRLNVTHKGMGVRVGPRGAGISIGPSGSRVSVSIPGTGISYSEKLPVKRTRTGSQILTAPMPLIGSLPESEEQVSAPDETGKTGLRWADLPFAVQLILAAVLSATAAIVLVTHLN
ncbi:DUF4236 domain-containing protein [Mesorhizobium sp. M0913]|uniref:DUF4236 domain-containing protein n=1 Tax=unclassified Mesorhizobium TaxID=325217 RepID=UPI003336E0C2